MAGTGGASREVGGVQTASSGPIQPHVTGGVVVVVVVFLAWTVRSYVHVMDVSEVYEGIRIAVTGTFRRTEYRKLGEVLIKGGATLGGTCRCTPVHCKCSFLGWRPCSENDDPVQ